jgi:hypothetical protein
MPKISKVGRFRATAAVDREKQKISVPPSCFGKDKVDALVTTDSSSAIMRDNNSSKMESRSRGQRRRMAKREQYLKREHMILSSLRLSREHEQKNKIDGFDSLWKALPTVSKEEEAGRSDTAQLIRKNKQKKNIAIEEVVHYNLVLQHPSFQTNPFGTMQEHLRNTLAKPIEQNRPTQNCNGKGLKEKKGIKNAVKSKENVQSKHSNYRGEKKSIYSATQQKPPKRHSASFKVEKKIIKST